MGIGDRKSVQKNVTLPWQLAKDLELEASRTGLNVSEFLRILIFNATESTREKARQLSSKAERSVNSSLEDYKNGSFTTLSTDEDIDKFF